MSDSGEFSDSMEVPKEDNTGNVVANQHFDEAHEVSADDETSMEESGLMTSTDMMPSDNRSAQITDLGKPSVDEDSYGGGGIEALDASVEKGREDDTSDEDEDEESGGAENATQLNLYNASDYKHLEVSSDIQNLFDHIERYKPHDVELDTQMKPFIPDYIPAVGDIDSFLKVPHPEGKKDGLGLTVLDEPAAQQSDPTVLDMRLRLASKQTNLKPITVRCIENADKEPKKITRWIENIQKVHREKPPPTVVYSKNMPDIEKLMQVWPHDFEELLKTVPLPPANIDLTTEQYSRIVCSVLDIPVYENLTESLHVLFTLYSEFKNNQHFQHM